MNQDWFDRLAERMKELDLSEADVVRRAELGESWFSDRKKGKAQQPKLGTIMKLAQAVNWSVAELLGENSPDGLRLMLQHRIQANEMWAEKGTKPKELPLAFLSQDLITLEVETNDYRSAGYRRGDVVSGARSFGQHIDNLVGYDCIVETADGQRLFKVLAKGSLRGRYDLKSFDPSQEDMRDVKIKWAAPIQLILRGIQ